MHGGATRYRDPNNDGARPEQWRGATNPLGDVVQSKPENEERAEPCCTGGVCGDRKALAETVRTDSECDVGREREPRGCVYRKPKSGRSGDEVRQGSHVT